MFNATSGDFVFCETKFSFALFIPKNTTPSFPTYDGQVKVSISNRTRTEYWVSSIFPVAPAGASEKHKLILNDKVGWRYKSGMDEDVQSSEDEADGVSMTTCETTQPTRKTLGTFERFKRCNK